MEQLTSIRDMVGQYIQKKEEEKARFERRESGLQIDIGRIPQKITYPSKVDQIDDEVLESIDSIPPGIDSFDAKSNLIESLLHRDTLFKDSQKINSLLDEFASELTLLFLLQFSLRE
ncbi:hypothetical protein Tco_0999248 [Tanacetum coccineum]